VKLKANNGIGYTYQWLLNNAVISGATNKTFIASQAGNYKVEVANTDDCSKISKKVTVFTSCKEIPAALIAGNAITAYPNPFHQNITIDLSAFNAGKELLQISITDLSGKILFKQNFSYEKKIGIGNELPIGFYLVELKSGARCVIIPIVKE
jgi:hypothetical protein